ncbi:MULTISPECIES: hypothetical protein [Caproicibacterium]|uniref:Uncharacterized protein n=1 Tax=Caproicibacterium argilliputei TaxID=3030016 RepID=A0AA97DBT1_9FIRM|nr:hypothetical protein [Caproicibacterium argilliputei]WOC32541.1 hypothetical protein PXC00_01340 [Caproicibacterium argilliputei]
MGNFGLWVLSNFVFTVPLLATFAAPVLLTVSYHKKQKGFQIAGVILGLFAALLFTVLFFAMLYGVGAGMSDSSSKPFAPLWRGSLLWEGGIQLVAALLQIPLFWYARRIKAQKRRSHVFLAGGLVCSAVTVFTLLYMIWPALTNQMPIT